MTFFPSYLQPRTLDGGPAPMWAAYQGGRLLPPSDTRQGNPRFSFLMIEIMLSLFRNAADPGLVVLPSTVPNAGKPVLDFAMPLAPA